MNDFMKHLDFPHLPLMKYNPMGINRDLCSLKKKKLTPQNSKLERNTRNHVVIFQNCYL